MRKAIIAAALLMLSGCGNSSVDNELIGQVKKVSHVTPLLCFDYVDADISLGVMRNGVGSMSTQDQWLTVPREQDQKILAEAAQSGKIVKVTYRVARVMWCWNDHIVTSAEIVE